MNASLVMRDKQTDSWWPIMTGEALAGPMKGEPLKEIPTGRKMKWLEWKTLYPDTRALSVDGKEHDESDPYERYYTASEGFRGMKTLDERLPDKEPIFVFKLGLIPYAVPHSVIEGGAVFDLGDHEVFLYRSPGDPVFASTAAYISESTGEEKRFIEETGQWRDSVTGSTFSNQTGFAAEKTQETRAAEALAGFNTFWYIWSSTYENVRLLR